MKNKKLFLPAIILAAAVFVIALYSFIFSIAQKPTVTEGEFPFSITYELDGETVTINEIYKARYDRNDGYADTKSRVYVGEIGDMGEGNTVYTLKEDGNTRIELWTRLYPDYLMGDPQYDYFDDCDFAPAIYYYDADYQEFSDEETLTAQGVKLISYEYPSPIENTLVFSHLSYLNGEVVPPTFIVALLALIATIIFVRKEKELKYKAIDIVSIVLGFVVFLTVIPFATMLALMIDIEGGGSELYYQLLYFIPAFSVLCTSASVALRRKGHGVKSLIAELLGPIAFALYMLVFYVIGALL
ncbi:MAG: hypothetical protein IKT54_00185 [Clostridia bacterium]|nr:hypothetical protein [Clostridia bacterium]